MTPDQTRTSRVCPNCDATILETNYRYDDASGLRAMYCEACDTTTVEEGAGARMDRMAQGESLDEIHDTLPETVRETISDVTPPQIEDTLITYVDAEGNETTMNHAEVVEEPEGETCTFPDCTETDDLRVVEGTGKVCDQHYKVVSTDLNDPEERRALRNDIAEDIDYKWSPDEE